MDYKSIFTRFPTSAKWQTSKSWFGAFAQFPFYLSSTACLCDVVNCEIFINCLPSWDIFILISMLLTPFCNIWYLHVCNAFAPQPATLDTCTLDMLNQCRSWKGKLIYQLMNSCLPFRENNFSPKISPKYERAQK